MGDRPSRALMNANQFVLSIQIPSLRCRARFESRKSRRVTEINWRAGVRFVSESNARGASLKRGTILSERFAADAEFRSNPATKNPQSTSPDNLLSHMRQKVVGTLQKIAEISV